MKMSRLLLTVAYIILAFGVGIGAVAAQGGPLTPGTPVDGTYTGEDQSYTISATAGQLFIVSLTSDDFDTTLTLNGADGTELASNDDGGEGTNSLLAYVAQTDGDFEIIVGAWSGEGAYTLQADVVDPVVVKVDGTASVEPDGANPRYAVFSGVAGQVVNVWATSQGEDDLNLTLFGVDSEQIEYDDDDGPGNVPYVRRVVLPADGLYLISVEGWFDSELTAAVDFTVETTEQLFMTADPYAVALSDDELGTEVFTFDATAGTTYRFTITSEMGTGVDLELLDTGSFFDPDFEVSDGSRMTWEYAVPETGQVRVDVHPSFFSDGDSYTFMLEVVQ